MALRFEIKGINDDESVCSLCGKTGLKKVVWLLDNETNEITAVGTTCAAKLRKISTVDQKKDEKSWFKVKTEEATSILYPYLIANHEAIAKAPPCFGSNRVTLTERADWINRQPEVIAYREEKEKLEKLYGINLGYV